MLLMGRGSALVALGPPAILAVANVLPVPLVQTRRSEAEARYFWKLSVVPDLSLRNTTLILLEGSDTPGFSVPAMAWVIPGGNAAAEDLPEGGAVEYELVETPDTLYVTAIGPKTTGRFQASEPQRFVAAATMASRFALRGKSRAAEVRLVAEAKLRERRPRTRSTVSPARSPGIAAW